MSIYFYLIPPGINNSDLVIRPGRSKQSVDAMINQDNVVSGHGWAVWHGFLQDRWLDRQRSIINVVPSDNKPVMFISMFPSWQYSLFYRIRIRSLLLLTDETISSALPLNATNLLEFSGCQLKEPYGLPQDKVGINLLRVPGGLPP